MNNSNAVANNICEAAKELKQMLDKTALVLTIIGALNWGCIGLFRFDIVAWIFGGQTAILSRIVYTVIALAGVWCISLLFRNNGDTVETFEK
jgi:uncharacterized membrane protein YuzA (DUF378 family)